MIIRGQGTTFSPLTSPLRAKQTLLLTVGFKIPSKMKSVLVVNLVLGHEYELQLML